MIEFKDSPPYTAGVVKFKAGRFLCVKLKEDDILREYSVIRNEVEWPLQLYAEIHDKQSITLTTKTPKEIKHDSTEKTN
jgi:ferredoxin-NADP reductase